MAASIIWGSLTALPRRGVAGAYPNPWSRLLHSRSLTRRHLSSKQRKTVSQLLDWKPADNIQNVEVDGYVRMVRKTKACHFVLIGDGSTRNALQAVVSRDQDPDGWGLQG
jgi:hypothetical protein